MKKNKCNGYQRKVFNRIQRSVILVIVLTTIATAFSVFVIEFVQGNDRLMKKYQEHTDTIAEFVQRVISRVDFQALQSPGDMESEDYTYIQNQLDIIRQVSDLQFLYTVRKTGTGEFIYMIDGQQPGSADFANLGDAVHSVLLPPIERVYETGGAVHDRRILQTEYGLVYSSYWPLRSADGELMGVIGMTFNADSMNYFDGEELLRGIMIAVLIAATISAIAVLVFRKVFEPFYRKLAYTDVLTGLDNRTAFELEMKRLQWDTDSSTPVAVVVFDLNNLKHVNDHYGHAAGDEYIRTAAHIISNRFHTAGGCYRIGGDEFSALCVGVTEDTLRHLLYDKFNQDIQKFQQQLSNSKLPFFSMAYGMQMFDRQTHQHIHDAFEVADNEMYAMKKQMKREENLCESAILMRDSKPQNP
ncbi:GGDEF domain-containing protein [Christensenellaceae bacterium OttesenSCG-928-K19]|nr:GGDEF domain-containing protein [Christensenellaceae bacterium OttesenSCG-928-K19]